MKVLTEIELRSKLRKMGPIDTYEVSPGTILTPAARSFLSDRKIEVIFSDEKAPSRANQQEEDIKEDNPSKEEAKPKYHILGTELYSNIKPEAYTHLNANNLVPKYHPRIKLRGKIDNLEAHILTAQITAKKQKMSELVMELDEILSATRELLRAEVLSEPVKDFTLFGFTDDQIREISHNPQKHIGVKHFMPSHEMGEMMVELNMLRTKIRETEIIAVETFFDPYKGLEREDIIKALNRLSSAVYVMMCKLLGGAYSNKGVRSCMRID